MKIFTTLQLLLGAKPFSKSMYGVPMLPPLPPPSEGGPGGGTKRGRGWEEGVRKQIITPGPRSRGGGEIQVSMCR